MKRDKIILVILVLALTAWRISRYVDQINATTEPTIFKIDLGKSKSKIVDLSSNRRNISHLNLLITGKMDGTGQLTISPNDSTIYKSFAIKSGDIKIEYMGDWYQKKCYLTYNSTSISIGELEIKYEFVGD